MKVHLAAPLAHDGVPLPVYIEETNTNYAIGWQGRYQIDGDAFLYEDHESRHRRHTWLSNIATHARNRRSRSPLASCDGFRSKFQIFLARNFSAVMKNAEHWKATKFEQTAKGWRGSRNPQHLAVSSRLSADLAVRAVAASIRKYARGRLLDLGCGAAPLYGLYRDRVDEVMCIDWPFSNHDTQYVDTFADLGEGIPYKSASFDTILCTSVLEHIADPDKMWAEIARVLAPGTRVIALIPFLYPLHELPHDYFRFTEFKLRQFCEEAGLQVLELKAYGGLLDVQSVLTAKLLSRYRLLCAWFTALCGVLLELTLTRALRRKTSKTFPLGYCLVAEKETKFNQRGLNT